MYRLTPYDSRKAEQFYQKFAPAIWRRVDYWLNQGTKQVVLEGRDTKAGRTVDIVLNVRVEAGSATYTFLRAVQKPIYLHWLMTFTPDHLDCVVDKILNMFPPDQRVLACKKLNRTIYSLFYQGQTDIDHFHTIVYDVFVDSVFDGEENGSPVFDRQWFCRKVGTVICPYCGAEDITTSPVNRQAGVTYVKPDVDHFLPKSKYPYLAMSYANLIPCSVTCNRSRKHTFDPIASLNPLQYKLMLPYLFDEQRLRFYYDIDNGNYLSEDAYQVKIDYYGDANLEEGYSQQMGIDGLYATKGYMLKDLYVSMSGVSDDYVRLMSTMGAQVKARDVRFKPSIVTFIGHPDTEEASGKYPYHKFYKDMAGQMINDGNCGWCW